MSNIKTQPKVSVIVPIYNVEKYLRKCVDSILNQTYKNLEVILVDDGSPDGCRCICDEYKEKDSRIVVIHKKNGGVSEARNMGIDAATGDYITFIDGDDWYLINAIETMVSAMLNGNTDIVSIGAIIVDSDYTVKYTEKHTAYLSSGLDFCKGICNGLKSDSVCTKLFKSEIIGNHRFKMNIRNEDFLFMVSLLINSPPDLGIATLNYSGYNYYSRADSATHATNKKPLLDAINNCVELKATAENACVEMVPYIARMGLHQSSIAMIVIPDGNLKESRYYKTATKFIKDNAKYILKVKLPIKEKIIAVSSVIAPLITANILRMLWGVKKRNG